MKAAVDERLVAAVLREAFALRSKDPEQARNWCHLAVLAARRLPTSGAKDLLPQCLANLGNAHRVLRDFERAGELLREAEFLAEGAAPLIQAEVASLYASYLTDVRQLAAAEARLREAEALTARWGSRHDLGKLKVQRAYIQEIQGRTKEAIETLTEAMNLLEGERDLLLLLMTLHNLADMLLSLGDFKQAWSVFESVSDDAYCKLGGAKGRWLRLWLKGRLMAGERRWHSASLAYEEARQLQGSDAGCLDRAILELDLVEANVELGDLGRAIEGAKRASSLCSRLMVGPELLVALCALASFRPKEAREEKFLTPLRQVRNDLRGYLYPFGSQPEPCSLSPDPCVS
ncbi:MAG: tetratricopeptide repeat protein [Acidobacteriota bacterium]